MDGSTPMPVFFEQIDELITAIPDTLQPPNSSALINNYLDHYSMNLVKETSAKSHQIWKSTIADYRIIEQRWEPLAKSHKTLILVHGYFDHTALYGKIIRWALEQGYNIHCFDLPGHGLSSGEPAAIDSFDTYSEVLTSIIERENYSHYSLAGQSTGCAVILNTLLSEEFNQRCTNKPRHTTLLAPLVRSFLWQQLRWLYFLLRAPMKSIKRKFTSSSHDNGFNEFLKLKDPLQATRIPLCWLGAMDEWIKKIQQLPPIPDLACTIIQGTGDATVDYRYNISQIQRCLPNVSLHLIPDAWHHLVNESSEYWTKVSDVLETTK